MAAPGLWPSGVHLKKVWIALGVTLLLSLVIPPAAILFQLVAFYWVGLLCINLVQTFIVESARRPKVARPPIPKRAYPPPHLSPDEWADHWLAICESPAEAAFLSAAVSEFGLYPDGTMLKGEVQLSLQEKISAMRVDFLLDKRLVVEIDGAAYHSSPKERTRDFKRDEKLKSLGYSVLRIPATVVLYQPQEAMRAVRSSLVVQ